MAVPLARIDIKAVKASPGLQRWWVDMLTMLTRWEQLNVNSFLLQDWYTLKVFQPLLFAEIANAWLWALEPGTTCGSRRALKP